MSTIINVIKNTGKKGVDLDVTQYWSGTDYMLQLTQGVPSVAPDEPGFIQLTKQDVPKLILALECWMLGNP